MRTTTEQDTEQREETDAVVAKLTHGTPIPPEVERRIRERGERARAENLRLFGVQEIATRLIRETRDE